MCCNETAGDDVALELVDVPQPQINTAAPSIVSMLIDALELIILHRFLSKRAYSVLFVESRDFFAD
jgi:hypothetical protein